MDLSGKSEVVPTESSPSPPYALQEQPPLSPTGYLDDLSGSPNSYANAPPYSPDDTPPWFSSPISPLDMPHTPDASPPYSPTSPPYSPTSPVYSPTSPGRGCCDFMHYPPSSLDSSSIHVSTSPVYSPTSPVYSPTSPGRSCCDMMHYPPSPPREDDDHQFHLPSPEYSYCCSTLLEHCECRPPSPEAAAANTACASGSDAD
ncbi:unnamed protein product [Alopecurus aequalis]